MYIHGLNTAYKIMRIMSMSYDALTWLPHWFSYVRNKCLHFSHKQSFIKTT